ncbi:hypothetical protein STAS_04264 [Striga asiatica]|uniref:KIB1-4 beta-propeller domain-containing protein n=1 Tax=Striga asiatica TaxID=4170 RepID=A0A5A7P701_STRAF|nr:hypothetical protein STAS_04264 [Striga asiatica]
MAAVTHLSNLCFSNVSTKTTARSNQPSVTSPLSLVEARTIRRKAFPVCRIRSERKPSPCRPTSTGRTTAQTTPPSSSPTSYPWLMLPPVLEPDSTTTAAYNIYSLAENRVVTLTCEGAAREVTGSGDVMHFRGSSHGWVALWNPRTHDMFLYNPISRRHITLPPFHQLPNYNHRQDYDPFRVEKIILSSSPDDQTCRAVIIYKLEGMMGFCCPGRGGNDKWAPMADVRSWWSPDDRTAPYSSYKDCVYSQAHGLFFALTQCRCLDSWDLHDPSSPVSTRIADRMSLRGSPKWAHKPKTRMVVAGRDILYEAECGDLVRCSSLGNWAVFVGNCSHAVAAQLPGFRPNSIYFTDLEDTEVFKDERINGHDIGILDYEKKTVSPCYLSRGCPETREDFPAANVVLPQPRVSSVYSFGIFKGF